MKKNEYLRVFMFECGKLIKSFVSTMRQYSLYKFFSCIKTSKINQNCFYGQSYDKQFLRYFHLTLLHLNTSDRI